MWLDGSDWNYRAFALGQPIRELNCTTINANPQSLGNHFWTSLDCNATALPVCRFSLSSQYHPHEMAAKRVLDGSLQRIIVNRESRPELRGNAIPGGSFPTLRGDDIDSRTLFESFNIPLNGRRVVSAVISISGILDDDSDPAPPSEAYTMTVSLNGFVIANHKPLVGLQHGSPKGQALNVNVQMFDLSFSQLRALANGVNELQLRVSTPPNGWIAISQISLSVTVTSAPEGSY